MQDYRKLVVWQKAHRLVLLIYQITRSFPKEERFNLTSQVRRSTTSIPTNIVEGCGKYTQADFANFLQIALGSTQETEYLCFLSRELDYVDDKKYKTVAQDIGAVKAMLISLITKLRT